MTPDEAKRIIGAQFYLPVNQTTKRDVPALYYRTKPVQFSDGSTGFSLEYYSSFNIWMGTNENDREKFMKERLISIE